MQLSLFFIDRVVYEKLIKEVLHAKVCVMKRKGVKGFSG